MITDIYDLSPNNADVVLYDDEMGWGLKKAFRRVVKKARQAKKVVNKYSPAHFAYRTAKKNLSSSQMDILNPGRLVDREINKRKTIKNILKPHSYVLKRITGKPGSKSFYRDSRTGRSYSTNPKRDVANIILKNDAQAQKLGQKIIAQSRTIAQQNNLLKKIKIRLIRSEADLRSSSLKSSSTIKSWKSKINKSNENLKKFQGSMTKKLKNIKRKMVDESDKSYNEGYDDALFDNELD